MNKYGGTNDFPGCDKRIYGLWFQMLRRCYDKEQQKRPRGKTYEGCEVCERWKSLATFAKDIQKLDGYDRWVSNFGYCLDKDMKIPGNKVYCKSACSFVPMSDNVRDISKRHKNITKNANESHKTKYILRMDGVSILFDSEKDACRFLGVKKCSVSSCYHKGFKCKGYSIEIAKMDGERKTDADTE